MNQESMEFDPLPSLAEYFIVAGISKADEKGMSWRRNNDRWPTISLSKDVGNLHAEAQNATATLLDFFPASFEENQLRRDLPSV